MPRFRLALCLSSMLAMSGFAPVAVAQVSDSAPVSERQSMVLSVSGSARSKLENWLVPPAGSLEMGATFAFLTSDAGAAGDEIKFTDIATLNPAARYSITDGFEIFGSAGFLIKQGPDTDESIFQTASLGTRLSLGERSALFAGAGGGLLLGDRGTWGGIDIGIQHRRVEHRILIFDLRGGASAMGLAFDDTDENAWLTEVFVGGEALVQDPGGNVAVWAGIDVAVPVVHDPDDATFDPQTRVGFHLGGALGVVRDLDLFALASILDRGDVEDPATTLPILNGGFDQTQIIFGVMKRFDLSEEKDPAMIAR